MSNHASSPAETPNTPETPASNPDWWRTAVIYQIYPKSFTDSHGDGTGDIPGITSRLDYLKSLGVDAIWISPFYPSPQSDGGYDVADYMDIDPEFGSLHDAKDLIDGAHDRGIRVIVDIVPNHTSDHHPWFRRALASPAGSRERDWYIFRDPDPADPNEPPNNWPSEFGGSAWSKTTDGQWYLHLFDSSQPDLNWSNPEVRQAFTHILRFWLDRGVDGFRVDVAHGLIKAPGLPDSPRTREELHADDVPTHAAPYWDQDGVHDVYRDWRTLLDSYPGQRIMVAEAWVHPADRLARYVRADEHHQAFNFEFLDATWSARDLRERIERSYLANSSVGAPTTWVLSNHDVIRHATRLALAPAEVTVQLGAPVTEPDRATGTRRARAATTLMLALPGSAYLYQGEELGLPEVLDLKPEDRQDPTFMRTQGKRLGRDGCRVPLPWKAAELNFGFSSENGITIEDADHTWLPQPAWFKDFAVDVQEDDPHSTLNLYRTLVRVRREVGTASGTLTLGLPQGHTPSGTPDLLTLTVTTHTGDIYVALNLGQEPWTLPQGATILVQSEPLMNGQLHTDQACWFTLPVT